MSYGYNKNVCPRQLSARRGQEDRKARTAKGKGQRTKGQKGKGPRTVDRGLIYALEYALCPPESAIWNLQSGLRNPPPVRGRRRRPRPASGRGPRGAGTR